MARLRASALVLTGPNLPFCRVVVAEELAIATYPRRSDGLPEEENARDRQERDTERRADDDTP
jgi:hypothetical protein